MVGGVQSHRHFLRRQQKLLITCCGEIVVEEEHFPARFVPEQFALKNAACRNRLFDEVKHIYNLLRSYGEFAKSEVGK